MMELPEAVTIAGQINRTVSGKRISSVTVSHTPHKLAWYYGEPRKYPDLLTGKAIGRADARGGLVEVNAGNASILFGEGVGVRFHGPQEPRPSKHQLLIEFGDDSALSAAVQMYGGLGAFLAGELENPYYKVAKEKPSPISPAFNRIYFDRIMFAPEVKKLSLKALLATEQRIPGLGNGVLQEILFKAGMHPKRKLHTLSEIDHRILFDSIKKTLAAMADRGGRDTELDLFGDPGGYKTLLSKNAVNKPCPLCGTPIKKEAYMGGSVYYCETCQRL